jgi:hypothetical protein
MPRPPFQESTRIDIRVHRFLAVESAAAMEVPIHLLMLMMSRRSF